MRRFIQGLLCVALFSLLVACGQSADQPAINTSDPTIYDLVAAPEQFAGKTVTVQGQYLWKPDGLSVLVKGVSTRDDGTDAQPLDTPVWLENMPSDIQANLHRPVDSAYGAVSVQGTFETAGGYGPDGSYQYRLTVNQAEAIETIQRQTVSAPSDVPAGIVPVTELVNNPEKYNGQRVTTHGFYFWTQATSGLLTAGIQTEMPLQSDAAGINPQPVGTPISMEGFPPDKSAELNVGPSNGFVWGLVEVSGTFQTGGTFGLNGVHRSQLIIEPDSVKPLK